MTPRSGRCEEEVGGDDDTETRENRERKGAEEMDARKKVKEE